MRTKTARPRLWLGLFTAALILAADQVSKWYVLNGLDLPVRGRVRVLPVLDLTMVWNHGVTFGMLNGLGAWSGPVIAVIALAIVVGLVLWLRRTTSTLVAVAIGSVAGGALGNVMDRLRHGAVVDFIYAHIGDWAFNYVFNIADAAIVCGVIALVLDSQWSRPGSGAGASDAACGLPKPPQGG